MFFINVHFYLLQISDKSEGYQTNFKRSYFTLLTSIKILHFTQKIKMSAKREIRIFYYNKIL